MNEKEVKVFVKSVGDDTLAFPRCRNAERFCAIKGSTYLTLEDVKLIELLGFYTTIMKESTED